MSKRLIRQLSKQPRLEFSIRALRWLGMSSIELQNHHSQQSNRLDEYFRVRKTVFVDNLKWDINHSDGLEIDRFDNDHAYYAIIRLKSQLAMAARGHRVGTPGIGALIEELFELYPKLEIPIRETDWDVTRLLINPDLHLSLPHKIVGFRALFALHRQRAKVSGCSRMLAVTNPRVPQHFEKIGVKTKRVSPVASMNENGSEIAVFAFHI